MLRRLLFQNTSRSVCIAGVSAVGFSRRQLHRRVDTSCHGIVVTPNLFGTLRQCVSNNNNNIDNNSPTGQSSSVPTRSAFGELKATLAALVKTDIDRLPDDDSNKVWWHSVASQQDSIAANAVECYFEKPKSEHAGIPPRQDVEIAVKFLKLWFYEQHVPLSVDKVVNLAEWLIARVAATCGSTISKASSAPNRFAFARLKTILENLLKREINQLPENDNNKLLWKRVENLQDSMAAAAVEKYFQKPTSEHGIPPRQDDRSAVKFLHGWFYRNRASLPDDMPDNFAEWLISHVAASYEMLSPKYDLQAIYNQRSRRLFGWFNAFASSELAAETNKRHDQNSSFCISPRGYGSFHTNMKETWRVRASRVFHLCGSSGSGKTVMALDLAHNVFSYTSIVFYLKASDLSLGIAGSAADHYDDLERNLINACESTMNNGEIVPPCFDNVVKMDAPNKHVIIVVDDCGTEPEVLRRLCSISPHLSFALHNKIFTDLVDDRSTMRSRVHFVACSTGAAYGTYGRGSFPDYLSAFYLDTGLRGLSSKAYHSIISDNHLWNGDERTFLRRLSSVSWLEEVIIGGQLSIDEQHMSGIVTNSRAAASFLELCKQAPRNDDGIRVWAASLPAFRQFVSSSIPLVTQTYFRSNTLWNLVDPKNSLSLATAFAFHRFPFIPATLKTSDVMRESPKSQKEIDDALAAITETTDDKRNFLKPGYTNEMHDYLCAKGGLFVDVAEKTASCPGHHFEITQFVPKLRIPPTSYFDADKEYCCRTFDLSQTFARFLLPAAQAAMAFSSIGLPAERSTSRTQRFAAEVCTVLAGSSLAIHNLYDAVNAEMQHFCDNTMEEYHAYCMSKLEDPLRALKQLLLFDRTVLGAEYHQLRSTPMSQIDPVLAYAANQNQNYFESFREKYQVAEKSAREVHELLEKALSQNKAVVLQVSDAEREFADIVVVGPGRVILIRCEANVKNGHFDCFGELLKLRILQGDSFVVNADRQKQTKKNLRFRERIGNMFREMFLAAILHAADRSHDKNSFENWLEKPRSWSNSKKEFEKGLSNADLDGTCPSGGNVDLHGCLLRQTNAPKSTKDSKPLSNLTRRKTPFPLEKSNTKTAGGKRTMRDVV